MSKGILTVKNGGNAGEFGWSVDPIHILPTWWYHRIVIQANHTPARTLHPMKQATDVTQQPPDQSRPTTGASHADATVENARHEPTAGTEPGAGDPLTPSLTKDEIFSLLSVERRRQTLEILRRTEDGTTLSALAEQIAADENDVPVDLVSSDQRKRVYIALYQSHLPKLDDAGVVEFEDNRGSVELAANAVELFPYLDLDPEWTASPDGRGRGAQDRLRSWVARLRG